jgi:chromosome segregation ATPase
MDAARGELRLKTNNYQRLNSEYQNARLRSKIVSVPPELAETKKAMETLSRQMETARQQYNKMSADLQELVTKENA